MKYYYIHQHGWISKIILHKKEHVTEEYMWDDSIYHKVLKPGNLTLHCGVKTYMIKTNKKQKQMISIKFGMVITSGGKEIQSRTGM